VRDILWEVDDDRDGGVDWAEFESIYRRVCFGECLRNLRAGI
jgi:hypothetical protein